MDGCTTPFVGEPEWMTEGRAKRRDGNLLTFSTTRTRTRTRTHKHKQAHPSHAVKAVMGRVPSRCRDVFEAEARWSAASPVGMASTRDPLGIQPAVWDRRGLARWTKTALPLAVNREVLANSLRQRAGRGQGPGRTSGGVEERVLSVHPIPKTCSLLSVRRPLSLLFGHPFACLRQERMGASGGGLPASCQLLPTVTASRPPSAFVSGVLWRAEQAGREGRIGSTPGSHLPTPPPSSSRLWAALDRCFLIPVSPRHAPVPSRVENHHPPLQLRAPAPWKATPIFHPFLVLACVGEEKRERERERGCARMRGDIIAPCVDLITRSPVSLQPDAIPSKVHAFAHLGSSFRLPSTNERTTPKNGKPAKNSSSTSDSLSDRNPRPRRPTPSAAGTDPGG